MCDINQCETCVTSFNSRVSLTIFCILNFQCSSSCGSGSRTRLIYCIKNGSTVDVSECGEDSIPETQEDCLGDCSSDGGSGDFDKDNLTNQLSPF